MTFNFKNFLEQEMKKTYFKNLTSLLVTRPNPKDILPPRNKVFAAYENFDFDNLKVILIGQDPYPTKGVADGLCFSSLEAKTPASLLNIFSEIQSSYPDVVFNSNCLQTWKDQGVLLMNKILTVDAWKPLSHKKFGWEIFNHNLLEELNNEYENIIYLLLGNEAKNFVLDLDLSAQHILATSHPSPLGCHKGFKGSKIFEKVNTKLKEIGKKEINWSTN
ncbi:uracil-DNA glycosylase [Metamycoplasma arthritidis]|uniref:Uracil-DNA glycosylase n=1 Tax=Metamycoplasma arthritidis (strain 158L3-1) TaxID=243272 RepID=B3PNE4_META1|nr:uracil-DNA glycosylase [Metamycoplasma arthritidis]ACF07546.1 uracil-DNA glycosylase [Metamycoplasma arthritidis 158L3-1]VEU79054.1 uracil-DNA glycosylase [Metamycoplasma arthritidis]